MRRFYVALVSSLFVVGCKTKAPPPTPVEGGPAPTEILLWGSQAGGAPRTYRLAPDGAGRAIAEMEGIVLATSRGEYRWETTKQPVDTEPCEEGAAPGDGEAMRAVLAPSSTGEVQLVVVPDKSSEAHSFRHHVTLHGSVGPYLFVKVSRAESYCRTHGAVANDFRVWDVEVGRHVDLLSEVSNMGALKASAKKILDDSAQDQEAARRDEPAPDLVQLVPKYDDGGRLTIDAQLARRACYACGDAKWSDYTQSAVVPSGWVPAGAASFVKPHPAVAAFLAAHPGFKMGGWSKR